jgi:putrescine aminotransferase
MTFAMAVRDVTEIVARTEQILTLLAKEALSPQEQEWLVTRTVEGFRDHVNPGFLEYRKAVSTDYTAVEWRDCGATFTDVRGREFIDCLGGYGIYNVGHRHPTVLTAVTDQLRRQALHSQELLDPLRALLADLLADVLPGDLQYSFFTNSGTESVEGALKLAMLATGRRPLLAATGGFHGKSLGSLSVTAKAVFRRPYLPLLRVVHVPFGDGDALEAALRSADFVGDPFAAVILEPIQGEGGINPPPDAYLPQVRQACDRYGTLLILDEVQTGMGRTGRLWACEHWGVVPDIIALGKAFGGGVIPAGAFAATAALWEPMIPNPFLHTTTFGGNPLACAAALATFHVLFREDLIERAECEGSYFLDGLRRVGGRFPGLVVAARGRGLMLGVEFVSDEAGYEVARGLFERGVLVAGTLINARVLRFEPPLTIAREQIDRVLEILDGTLQQVAKKRSAAAAP